MVYESVNIPLWRALQSLRGRRVLDVGCGAGALGELLERAGNTVTGLTHSAEEARLAATRLHAVKLVDLDDPAQVEAALTETYDVILCADVLEHLRNPSATLTRLLRQLAPGGLVGVSLPNIACFSTRLGLLFGLNRSKTGRRSSMKPTCIFTRCAPPGPCWPMRDCRSNESTWCRRQACGFTKPS